MIGEARTHIASVTVDSGPHHFHDGSRACRCYILVRAGKAYWTFTTPSIPEWMEQ